MNNTLNKLAIESGIYFDNETDTVVTREDLTEFARNVVAQFLVEVIRFQEDTGSNSMDECLVNAEVNLFGEDFDQSH